jgi:cytochrome c-type biogenesis protein CcmH/NrfG
MCTLATVVVVFAAHQLIDWTWYTPAPSVLALLAAGWVAGRGPLRERLTADPEPRRPLRSQLLAWHPHPYRSGLAAGVLIVGMLAAWTVLQPLRAVHAGDAAVARLQIGQLDAARDIARIGARRNPLSVEPQWELATVEASAGRTGAAEDALERAVEIQPANAEAWRRLGRYRLSVLDRPQPALNAFRAAYYLDPQSPDSTSDFLEVSRRLQATGAPPAP